MIVGNTVLYGATEGRGVLPRARRRAVRGAQLRRGRGRRGRRRPRLRVHDRRPRGRARPHGPQLRRRDERRHRLRPRRGRRLRRAAATWSSSTSTRSRTRTSDALRALVEEHRARTGSPVAARVLAEWDELLPRFVKVMPRDYKRRARRRSRPGTEPRATPTTIRSRAAARASSPPRSRAEAAAADGRARRLPEARPGRGPGARPEGARRATTTSSCARSPASELAAQGARCMECGVPFCHNGCPVNNLIPDWNDLVYRDRWQRGDRAAPPHEQLPRLHRAALPRPVRGGLRARDPRGRGGDDQADRARDHQPRLGRGLGRAAAAAVARPDGRSP